MLKLRTTAVTSRRRAPHRSHRRTPMPGACRPERHLTVTPLDMRQARFATAMRGFDKTEVTAFLEEAASDYEQALRENDRLRQQIARLEASLTQYRELEGGLKSDAVSAQKVADDMRRERDVRKRRASSARPKGASS